MALRTDVPLSGLLIVILPLMAAVIGIVMSRAIPLFRAMQVKLDRINQVMRETLVGRPGHPGVRADPSRGGTLRRRERRPLPDRAAGQPPVRGDDPDDDRDLQSLDGRGDVVRRDARRRRAAMQIGELTAFLQYLMPDPVRGPDRGLHVHPHAAGDGLRRAASRRSSRPSRRSPTRPTRCTLPGRRAPRPSSSSATSSSAIPGAEQPVLHAISFAARPGETTAIIGSTGSGKTTLINLIPRLYDVDRRRGARRRRRRPRAGPRGPLGADRVHPAEGLPVQRDRRQRTCASATRTPRTRSCGGRSRSRRGATSSRRWRAGSRRPITQGGTQRLGRPAPAARDRPGARQARADLRLRRQLLGARLRDRRAAARGARARARRRRP